MKKTNRKAFTLVELVIVIAVIAILAAVMIPTFGGIIQSANEAADKSTAANLTIAISQKVHGIKTADDLHAVIVETFGEDYANEIAPKTANSGNHFWYNANTKTVVFANYDDLDDYVGATAYVDSGVTTVNDLEGISPFAPDSYRTMSATKGSVTNYFFLIDKGGDIGTILSTFDDADETNNDVNGLIKIINSTEASQKNKSLAEAIYNRLGAVSVISSFKIDEENDAVKFEDGAFYIPYDIKNATFFATEFRGSNGVDPVNTDVVWSTTDESVATIDATTGKVTVKLPEPYGEGEVTIKATAKEGGCVAEATIKVVRIDVATLTTDFGAIALNNNNNVEEIEIKYDGRASYSMGSITALTTNHPGASVVCDKNFTVSTSGDIFSVNTNNELIPSGTKFGTQSLTVTVGEYIVKTVNVTITDNTKSAFKVNSVNGVEMGTKYLFRVGNDNAFTLDKLFNAKNPDDVIALTIYDASTYSDGEWDLIYTSEATEGSRFWAEYDSSLTSSTWAGSEIQFHGTGVAIIEISTAQGTKTLAVEVVNGNNVVSGGSIVSGTNNILLENYTLSSGTFAIKAGEALWGNGFTLDITKGANNQKGIITVGGVLDNVKVIGAVYEGWTNTTYSTDSSSAVHLENGGVISNSYISGCRAAVRIEAGSGSVKIINTTLEGGRYANINIENGTVILENITTINQPHDGVVGLGIVVGHEASADSSIIIKGTFTQYNYLQQSDAQYAPNNTTVKEAINKLFSSSYSDIQSVYNGTTYVSTGIIFLNNFKNITDTVSGYTTKDVTINVSGIGNMTGKIYTAPTNNNLTSSNMTAPEWKPTAQSAYEPTFSVSGLATEKNDASDYIYFVESDMIGVNDKLNVGNSSGSYTIDNILSYVSCDKFSDFDIIINITTDCGTVNGNSVTITGDGTITFTVEDNNIYDESGKLTSNNNTYSYTIDVDYEKTSKPTVTITKSSDNNILWSKFGYLWDYQYGMCIPVLEGLVITDSNGNVVYNGTGQMSVPSNLTITIKDISGNGSVDDLGNFVYYKKYNNKLYYCTGFDAKGFNDPDKTSKVVVEYYFDGGDQYQSASLEVTFTATSTSSVKSSNFKNP